MHVVTEECFPHPLTSLPYEKLIGTCMLQELKA